MEYITLNNGVEIPATGFGVFRIEDGAECVQTVVNAIESGYRMLDTAQGYWNERSVGDGIRRSGIDRKELFLTTKVWMSRYGEEDTYRSVLESMEKLQTDYLDLVLLHQPLADYYGAYCALERLYHEGRLRAIGVSNFDLAQITDLTIFNQVVPAVNQIQINPYIQRHEAEELHRKYNIRLEAHSPLGSGNAELLRQPVLTEIGARYGKSPVQVIIRWLFQRGIVTIAKTTQIERMKANLTIFDFELIPEDVTLINELDQTKGDTGEKERADLIVRLKSVIDKESFRQLN